MPRYTAKKGDCISSIAESYGFFWETIWEHPENAKLHELRNDPNILFEGDVVFIPDKRPREESGATETKHRFRKKGVPAMFCVQLLDDGEPRANLPYVLEIDRDLISGTTDAAGKLQHPIPPKARRAILTIADEDPMEFRLGALDPIDTIFGVKARLANLGYDVGSVDNKLGPKTHEALEDFQREQGLEPSGKLDEATRDTLVRVHGS